MPMLQSVGIHMATVGTLVGIWYLETMLPNINLWGVSKDNSRTTLKIGLVIICSVSNNQNSGKSIST